MLTDEQIFLIRDFIDPDIGYIDFGTHGLKMTADDLREFLVCPDMAWAIIDKLIAGGERVELMGVVPNSGGQLGVIIKNAMILGTGPTNAEALLDALIKYLEAGE